MQQSNVIAGALAIAFIVFITLRGELPAYLDILRGGGATAAGTQNTSIGVLPTMIDGAQVIVTQPSTTTTHSTLSDPVQELLSTPQSYGIPSLSGGL